MRRGTSVHKQNLKFEQGSKTIMAFKPWREIAIPHEDVLKGTFQQAEFAADISRVHQGSASPEYQNAELFFQRTFITEGMRLLLDSVVKRLSGKGGDPVIRSFVA